MFPCHWSCDDDHGLRLAVGEHVAAGMDEGEVGGPVPERLDDGRVVGRHRHADRHADELAEGRPEGLPGHEEVCGLLGRVSTRWSEVWAATGRPPSEAIRKLAAKGATAME